MRNFKFIHFNLTRIILVGFLIAFFAVNLRMNLFSYNNFDFGKFDLGNMNQMIWNTLNGRFLYLTDYFGTNLPRWAMSHVDPILVLFVPVFALFPHPLTIVYSQILLILIGVYIFYELVLLLTKNKRISLYLSLGMLCYPALGYLTARTGFHGVSAAIPFFIAMVYVFEKSYINQTFSKKAKILYWTLFVITLSGKEQISLYLFLFGLYIIFFRSNLADVAEKIKFKKVGLATSVISIIWFITAFFIIIPAYANHRVDGYNKFLSSMDIDASEARDVALPNYFLSRYAVFGDDYIEIAKNIILKPDLSVRVFFGGDKIDNFRKTFEPLGYTPLLVPQVFVWTVPDLMMNYLTSESGIGTAEISNHRISMVIPVLFIASAFFFAYLLSLNFRYKLMFAEILAILFLVLNLVKSYEYNNPVIMWVDQALKKRVPQFLVHAKTDSQFEHTKQYEIGDIVRISALESKDIECAQRVVDSIPEKVSVSGPDFLGAHLSLRETYAIFPALYSEADYVIVDVFSRKLLTILDLDPSIVKNVIDRIVTSPNYDLQMSCGNLFVFKKTEESDMTSMGTLLPIQERYDYPKRYEMEIHNGLKLVDFSFPRAFERSVVHDLTFVYQNTENLSDYFMFLTLVNNDTGELYQAANLPSYSILEMEDWREDYYYVEKLKIAVPTYTDAGVYSLYLGMSNRIRTRSIYLGTVEIK